MVERKKIAGGGGETGAGARGIGEEEGGPSLAQFTFHRVFIFLPFHYLRALDRLFVIVFIVCAAVACLLLLLLFLLLLLLY